MASVVRKKCLRTYCVVGCRCQRRFIQSNSTQSICSVSLQTALCVLVEARVCSDHGLKAMLMFWLVEQVFACLLFAEQDMCLLAQRMGQHVSCALLVAASHSHTGVSVLAVPFGG